MRTLAEAVTETRASQAAPRFPPLSVKWGKVGGEARGARRHASQIFFSRPGSLQDTSARGGKAGDSPEDLKTKKGFTKTNPFVGLLASPYAPKNSVYPAASVAR